MYWHQRSIFFPSIDKFQEQIAEARADLTGKLRIALFDHSSTNPNANVYGAIQLFRDRAPGVTLDISMEPPNIIEEGVINDRFNLGIVPLHRQSPMLAYTDLYTEKMHLYCGRTHELFDSQNEEFTVDELRKFAYVGLSFNSPNMAVHQKLKLRKSAFVQNEEALALLILSGRYLGFLPTHTAQPFLESGLFRRIDCHEASFTSVMAAIVRKSASKGRRLNLFLDCLNTSHAKRRENSG